MTTRSLPPAPDAPAHRPHPVVVARDLVRRYGDGDTAVNALDGVSLAVEPASSSP